jgi:ElaB/YqjD/DUF883 family membrane-anchored ribosome-binding protein
MTDIAEIQRRMAQIRHDMHQEVQGAVKGAQLLTDWRGLVKSYPWLSVSLVAIAGYVIVPRRQTTYSVSVGTLPASTAPTPVTTALAQPRRSRRPGWNILGTAFSLLAPVATRVAQNYALGHLEQWLSQHPLPASPSSSSDEHRPDRGQPARMGPGDRRGQYGWIDLAASPSTQTVINNTVNAISWGDIMMNRLSQYDPISPRADDANSTSMVPGVAAITDEAQNWLANASGEIEDFVKNRPVLAVAAALAAGVFLGWLIKRR